jgi:hypothetical protein
VTIDDPGFDAAAVQTTLRDWLLEKRIVEDGPDAIDIAMQHIELHAMQPTPPDAEPSPLKNVVGPCLLSPCRAAGVSFALFEVTVYRIEMEQGLVPLIRALDSLAVQLGEIAGGAAIDVLRIAHKHYGKLRDVTVRYPDDFVHVAWRAPAGVFSDIARLRDRTESVSVVLRTYLDSHAAEPATRGRPAQSLLAALTQHLDSGGFTYAEIASLLPDGIAGDPKAAAERVRKRANGEDRRRLVAHPRG